MSSNAGGVLASRVAVALTSLRDLRESELLCRDVGFAGCGLCRAVP